ncbi:dihydrofolate reductase [Crocinitomicaceae bacterium]|nr:dihydrofolate reductase [Crocinitomicaceae bacterium]
MNRPIVSFVVAMSKQTRAIGLKGDLIWKIPEDIKHFKDVTMGHPMIMGRKTFDSIGRVLPGRTSVVITKNKDLMHDRVVVCHSIEDALRLSEQIEDEEITVIGGGAIFKLSIPYVTRIYLTEVDDDAEGDAYFPELDESNFIETDRKEGNYNGLSYVIRTLDKK